MELIIVGIIFGFIPFVLFFEIYYLITKKDKISYPYLKAEIVCIIAGLLLYIYIKASKPEALGAAISLILFLGFILSGIFVAIFYDIRKRPLLPRRTKK